MCLEVYISTPAHIDVQTYYLMINDKSSTIDSNDGPFASCGRFDTMF